MLGNQNYELNGVTLTTAMIFLFYRHAIIEHLVSKFDNFKFTNFKC